MRQQSFTFGEKKVVAQVRQKVQTKIYSVSEIVSGARSLIETEYADVWVLGEVSGFKHHSSGHCYFSLKDSSSVLPSAIFRGAASSIKFKIEDGLELICHGRLSLYQRGGQYQMIVDYVEPKGVGELQLAFEQLKKKLDAEGLFAMARKRKIPFMPRRIGVVTSPTGAAIRDIIKVLKRRFPNIEILLAPARVQGDGSAQEIASAIEYLNKLGDIDVLIVGRGGGSLEDLWAFNEEIVARAIYNSQIPVISAVGHEIDFTIADFVADLRAPTPSAAAEHAVPVRQELLQYIDKEKRQLVLELRRYLSGHFDRVSDLFGRLSLPTRRLPEYYKYIDGLKDRMNYSLQVVVNQKEKDFKSLVSELSHLSPLAILSKGYSVVTKKKDNKAIRSVNDLKVGDELKIRFCEGVVESKVGRIGNG